MRQHIKVTAADWGSYVEVSLGQKQSKAAQNTGEKGIYRLKCDDNMEEAKLTSCEVFRNED